MAHKERLRLCGVMSRKIEGTVEAENSISEGGYLTGTVPLGIS